MVVIAEDFYGWKEGGFVATGGRVGGMGSGGHDQNTKNPPGDAGEDTYYAPT